ncbi:MAG: hypothetical protein AB1457_11855 [Chloroflexota bacterium]|nr:MAG: hypothetical protein KatS3mg045_1539 [Bellilinea sp.]
MSQIIETAELPLPAEPVRNSLAIRVWLLLGGIFGLLTLPDLLEKGRFSGWFIVRYLWQWSLLIAVCFFVSLTCLFFWLVLQSGSSRHLVRLSERLIQALHRLGRWNYLFYACGWLATAFFMCFFFPRHFTALTDRLWILWMAAGVTSLFLIAAGQIRFFWALSLGMLSGGFLAVFLTYAAKVSPYPFTLGWSEASRYYYASLPFAKQIYGFSVPLSPLHASRYLLLSMAYIIPDSPLWFHRLWQVILWIGMNLATGWAMSRRLGLRSAPLTVGTTLWAFLFLMQGPVYYHLHLCILPVLLGYHPRRPIQTLTMVILASIWAGLSRVNWFPVPAMLAISIYLLETPYRNHPNLFAYFARPLIWGAAGLISAFAAQAAYIPLSGNPDPSLFASSFTSSLLWHRLLPSATSGWGILPLGLIISLPLLMLIALNTLRRGAGWHPLRLLGLAGIGTVLLVGGLVVSTKIGGGSNLHNLDAYFVVLMVIGAYVVFGKAIPDQSSSSATPLRPTALLLLTLSVPVVWSMVDFSLPAPKDLQQAQITLNALNQLAGSAAQRGEVLFISQRHLLTFGYIRNVPLVADYELLLLSEASISNNRTLLERFYADLRNRRFSMIIVDRLNPSYQRPKIDPFAEENNLWVDRIAFPILEYYGEEAYFGEQNLQVLVPK